MRLEDSLLGILGGKTANPMAEKLGLHTVSDLLRHYPRRYKDNSSDLGELQVGQHITVIADVLSSRSMQMKNRAGSRQEVVISDGRSHLRMVFFAKKDGSWRTHQLAPGVRGIFSGDVTMFNGKYQLAHPDYVLLGPDNEGDVAGLWPIYPAAEKIRSWAIQHSLQIVLPGIELGQDPLPVELRKRHALMDQDLALHGIHQPDSWAHLEASRKRLRWDEALALQVALARRRAAAAAVETVARAGRRGGLLDAFLTRLPFDLTTGQQEIVDQITAELAAGHPMHRLLQGEVGSGKTMVALLAMLQVIDSGGQAALLAPTEVLAMQHYRSITSMLGSLAQAGMLGGAEAATRVTLLTGSMGAKAKRQAMLEAQSGEAGIVIGTHALIEDRVGFADLGLVVVDEQHRFGVRQRDALRMKGISPPHVLVMTATPIPRTIAMTVFGDLEVSTLRELPKGRSPISTFVVPDGNAQWIERMWRRIHDEVRNGHQAYVVFPRIGDGALEDTGDDGEWEFEEEEATLLRRPPLALLEQEPILREGALKGLRVGVLHGRMAAEDKDATMSAFTDGELDVLLATTVVEVGVDVANATVMVIVDADRFGISQLHQLRGRVGRGSAESWCLLHTGIDPASPAAARINAVASTLDGFALAQVDLEQRKEGDVLGDRQSGDASQLRLLSLVRDVDVIAEAREEAIALVRNDPDLASNRALGALVRSLVDDEAAEFLERG